MRLRTLALAALAAAGIGLAGAPADADGIRFSFGVHGGHGGHKHGHFRHKQRHFGHGHGHFRHFGHSRHRPHFWRRHWRNHYRSHFGLHWRPAFPHRQVYIYRQNYYAPPYEGPAYAVPPPVAAGTSYCREYTREVIVDGQPARAFGQACRQPDGSWRIVSEE